MLLCGKELKIGDYVEVEFSDMWDIDGVYGDKYIIKGKITEFQDELERAVVNDAWCFYDHDKILEHIKSESG